MTGSTRPLILACKELAGDDGPGLRTTVFFKGCPLRCWWCHNPESQECGVEIAFSEADCLHCGACVPACPRGAVSLTRPVRIDRRRCDRCGACVAACPGRGLRFLGNYYPTELLLERLRRDRVFYDVSGGGVTFSGGEPTLYLDYLAPVLRTLKREGIHTAIQTNGFFRWQDFADLVLDFLDLICFDVKLADPQAHEHYTGRSNALILENLRRLLRRRSAAVLPRVPLVPGVTATAPNLEAISRLFRGLGIRRCTLLPYNPTGLGKARQLGQEIPPGVPREGLSPQLEEECRAIFAWAELVDW